MRGGNRTDRKRYSRGQIEDLVDRYIKSGDKLYSPVTGKVYQTHRDWFTNIVYWMDKPSTNYFFYLLEPPHYSKYSGVRLTEDSFSYSDTYRGYKGWKKYTPDEIKRRVWTKLRDYTKTEEERQKISATLKAFNQTDVGRAYRRQKSERMRRFYSTDAGKEHKRACVKKGANTLSQKISSGEYMPRITNTWTHWDAKILLDDGTERKFRSSWEACFWFCNQHCLYESIRVRDGKKVYVSDFYDDRENILYEIKPKNRHAAEANKMLALRRYCEDHHIQFIWINEDNISLYIDERVFVGENLQQLNMMKKAYE